jgi:hypothetical protein
MLGVIIGSGCIVLVVTVALVGKRYIITQIEATGSNLVYAGLTHSNNSSRLTLSDEISLGDMDAVKSQIPEVAVASGASDIAMTVVTSAGVPSSVRIISRLCGRILRILRNKSTSSLPEVFSLVKIRCAALARVSAALLSGACRTLQTSGSRMLASIA